MKNYIENK